MPSMRFNCAHLIFKHATNMQNLPAYNKGVIHMPGERIWQNLFGLDLQEWRCYLFFALFLLFFFFFFFFVVLHLLCFGLLDRAWEKNPKWMTTPQNTFKLLKQNHLNNLVVHSTINKDKVSIFQKDNTKSVNHLFLRVFQRYFTIQKFLSLKKNEKDFFITSLTSLHLRFVFIKKNATELHVQESPWFFH